jgi:tRNA(fMet)-specific endonuclease VapC
MKYLLDTNACIIYLKFPQSNVRKKLEQTAVSDVVVCSVVKAELFYGAMKSQNPVKTLAEQRLFLDQFQSLPFDDDTALVFGEIYADLAKKGTPIGAYDIQIAAIALVNNVTLITHNTAEFIRTPKLQLEDWETP